MTSDAQGVVLASVSCQLQFSKDKVVSFVAFQCEPLWPHVAEMIGQAWNGQQVFIMTRREAV